MFVKEIDKSMASMLPVCLRYLLTIGWLSYIFQSMTFILNKDIDNYIRKTKNPKNKKIAQHLKEIIPQTTHLNENTYNEIIKELKKEIVNGKDFKNAFLKMCEKYFLRGDIIEAELPDILTRIIPNKNRFISNILYLYKRSPSQSRKLKMVFASGDKDRIIRTLRKLRRAGLSGRKVVFATFFEKDNDKDPFLNHSVIDIINMLALDKDVYEEDEPYTAIKVRYRNDENFDKRYPTFIDAGWYDKYHPADKDDNYGRTKSLDDSLQCMPEVVHENMKLSDVIVEDIDFLEDD